MLAGQFFLKAQTGKQKKFSDTIPVFSTIIATGNVNIIYYQDEYFSVTFKGKNAILKDIYSSIKIDHFSLKIDASKLFQNEFITVEIIAPSLDSIKLFNGASFKTHTNIWLNKLYVENYSERNSIFYINSNELHFTSKGHGRILLSGIIDILYITVYDKINLELETISKYINLKSYHQCQILGKGKSFACECHSFQSSIIDASQMLCGRAKAFSLDESVIDIKSEEKPLILPLNKSRINFLAPDAILIDSTQSGKIKKLQD
ncbi:MAG: DUF2807 domain-containing protein [Bacteroidales bacterium]|nr:DUF2807 domain-containing protein [Bacteroidales bacterium]